MKITETDLFFNKGFVEGMKSERKRIVEEIEKKFFIPDGNNDFYAIEIGIWEDIKNGN